MQRKTCFNHTNFFIVVTCSHCFSVSDDVIPIKYRKNIIAQFDLVTIMFVVPIFLIKVHF